MSPTVRNTLSKTTACWLAHSAAPVDPVAQLSEKLGSGWNVERHTDYRGKKSIVVFSSAENGAIMPTYILYEENGATHVGLVRDDVWNSDRSYATLAQAVAAIIAEAQGFSISRKSPMP